MYIYIYIYRVIKALFNHSCQVEGSLGPAGWDSPRGDGTAPRGGRPPLPSAGGSQPQKAGRHRIVMEGPRSVTKRPENWSTGLT